MSAHIALVCTQVQMWVRSRHFNVASAEAISKCKVDRALQVSQITINLAALDGFSHCLSFPKSDFHERLRIACTKPITMDISELNEYTEEGTLLYLMVFLWSLRSER